MEEHCYSTHTGTTTKKVFKCDYLRLNVSDKIYEIEAFFQKCFSMSFKTTGIIKFKYHWQRGVRNLPKKQLQDIIYCKHLLQATYSFVMIITVIFHSQQQ